MIEVKAGDRVRITAAQYFDPASKTGLMANPGDIALVEEWINLKTIKVRSQDGGTFLLPSTDCEPI